MTTATHKARLLLSLLLFPFLITTGHVRANAAGTQISDSAHKLIEVKVTGSKRFSTEAVVAASGLQLGVTMNEEEYKKAARNLAETGAFSDIGYKFSYSSAGTKLELQLTDTAKWLPVHFEDFVWFSDDEMQAWIKEHVPLFTGDLPTSGRMPEEVSDALQAMLVRNGIAGHVDYVRESDPNGQHDAFDFSVANVLIQVRKVEFTGAGADELPLLEAAAAKMPDREYSRSRLTAFADKQLLTVLRSRGFMKASFGPPVPHVMKAPESASADETRNQTFVDVSFAVTPGLQYKLAKLDWAGNKEFPTDTLKSIVHAPTGEPLNIVKLTDALLAVQTLYGSRGYITASIKADAEFDDAATTVGVVLNVTEGSVYHMGELEYRGLDNSLTAKLRAAWKLRQGDVYDATYLKEYLPEAHKLLPRSLDWEVASHVTANVRDKSVDVDLVYSVKAPK
jgi:outer membrane protein assembly factor BamA